MEKPKLDRMRTCFAVAAAWQGWSDHDKAEYSAAIRDALAAGDKEALAWWSAYLEQASGLAHLAALCRAVEGRIKAARKESA